MRIRRSPVHPMVDLHRRMEQVMQRLLQDTQPLKSHAQWAPRTDIYETAEEFVITLEIPGIDHEEIEILIEGSYLSVSGSRVEPGTQGCVRWHQMEITHGRFERVLTLPQEADPERITATYDDGFLSIHIPRGPAVVRSVPIKET
ncbi:MAG TPA: Hsp20/alpha crystallin family protein [Candidatus Polarisedimenticolia bacterium]|nr:Hsp20/alpha crystallin family protein [Candidatus Polarisedimenticolia bacterium]